MNLSILNSCSYKDDKPTTNSLLYKRNPRYNDDDITRINTNTSSNYTGT